MSELTFIFPLGTLNLSFSKMNSPCSPKEKEKIKKKTKKEKENENREWGERKRKKSRKNFVGTLHIWKVNLVWTFENLFLNIPLCQWCHS